MTKKIIMGIDTSNYTTSVALMYSDGELIANIKRPLEVKPGERGLRQSDAVFSHIKNIPSAMQEARSFLDGRGIDAIGVSERPRNVDGSYMPCFLSGVASAESISASFGVPIYRFSHQCGHIMSALFSSGAEESITGRFGAFHISGGTTELLIAERSESGFFCELVGGTKDLNAGQVIDRVGVSLGLPFPAGMHMEKLALEYDGKIKRRKPSVNNTYMNLSGLENMALDLYSKTNDKPATAAFVFNYIGESVIAVCEAFIKAYGDLPIVFAGGVMCNTIIKSMLEKRFNSFFASPMLSADNAVGIAELTRLSYINSK